MNPRLGLLVGITLVLALSTAGSVRAQHDRTVPMEYCLGGSSEPVRFRAELLGGTSGRISLDLVPERFELSFDLPGETPISRDFTLENFALNSSWFEDRSDLVCIRVSTFRSGFPYTLHVERPGLGGEVQRYQIVPADGSERTTAEQDNLYWELDRLIKSELSVGMLAIQRASRSQVEQMSGELRPPGSDPLPDRGLPFTAEIGEIEGISRPASGCAELEEFDRIKLSYVHRGGGPDRMFTFRLTAEREGDGGRLKYLLMMQGYGESEFELDRLRIHAPPRDLVAEMRCMKTGREPAERTDRGRFTGRVSLTLTNSEQGLQVHARDIWRDELELSGTGEKLRQLAHAYAERLYQATLTQTEAPFTGRSGLQPGQRLAVIKTMGLEDDTPAYPEAGPLLELEFAPGQ